MNMNLHLILGPVDDRLLYLGAEHRARNLFLNPQEGESCTMDFRRGDGSFWELIYDKHITLTGKVLRYISLFGFGGVIRCGYRRLDRALIEALVERWRPETNTFHLPFGEATVTLEDVNVLWGLPIEGVTLTGVEASLYRELYKGTNPQKSIIGGPMSLLQIWAWTRIRPLAPRIVDEQIDWKKPYGARWVEHHISRTETPSHVIKAHHTTLQNLREADVLFSRVAGYHFKSSRLLFKELHACESGRLSFGCIIFMRREEENPKLKLTLTFALFLNRNYELRINSFVINHNYELRFTCKVQISKLKFTPKPQLGISV
ncbi:hypothetical protein E3N88_30168 [Mikania micrantha]|uniref:Aminotransferase-like plant mobile domain-containing protein n=1 Tax=Mikania micrantha TaxID=192012 RepID=A0A5N6MKU4_9ASTR|nr:hypothetical protein E3N88_30168 [Mikania micrantha]